MFVGCWSDLEIEHSKKINTRDISLVITAPLVILRDLFPNPSPSFKSHVINGRPLTYNKVIFKT